MPTGEGNSTVRRSGYGAHAVRFDNMPTASSAEELIGGGACASRRGGLGPAPEGSDGAKCPGARGIGVPDESTRGVLRVRMDFPQLRSGHKQFT